METQENLNLVTSGFGVLVKSLAPYIAGELTRTYGNEDWWKLGVLDQLYDDQRRDLPVSGSLTKLVNSLDVQRCLLLIDIEWKEVFRKKLPQDCKNYVMELKGTRNKWAHTGSQDFSTDDTCRALDTMSRLCEHIDPDAAAKINTFLRKARYGAEEGSTAVVSNAPVVSAKQKTKLEGTIAVKGLPSWREIMEPHMDVAEGRYKNAEFAADLAQVASGKGELEYRDPVEFFNRTYLTEGMKGLLVQALRRVSGLGGEPVIQLKTAFGGGKTHSMLALYHMMRSRNLISQIKTLQPVLEEADIKEIPEVHVVTLVGTSIDPSRYKQPHNMTGIRINTLWGEIAYQLAESTENPSIYNYVKEADKKGVSPGSEVLANVFDTCGCCLILLDELVAYAKKLYGQHDLPAGTFDNFIVFIQELTEAARRSNKSLVVASIPESETEIGGDAGQIALEQIEHTFGRVEAIWKPVGASEGFEVVRRRLFLDCKDDSARENVCAAFSRMYNENANDFPVDARELEYKERMISCYPIHPEVFDRLYEDWASLEGFQRTRGVLRLTASVIHELWMNQDASPMIMPGSFAFDIPAVRDELTRYLSESWNSVVDSEVDGKNSLPYRQDANNTRYGSLLASRRVARSILLGSAPDVEGQSVRGIEQTYIHLGVVQPNENISVFNDALSSLQSASSYLYSDGSNNRFWYNTRPTLRKVVADRAQLMNDSDAQYEIEKRLGSQKSGGLFTGIHICPSKSLDIPDEDSLRLVILSPMDSHRKESADSNAVVQAKNILENRGDSLRKYKNMLVFVACDGSVFQALINESKSYLAWNSINDDRDNLNLDRAQIREVEKNIKIASGALDLRMLEAYSWLLVPHIDDPESSMAIIWSIESIAGSGEPIATKAARKLLNNEEAIEKWSPIHLRTALDRILWKDNDYIEIGQLWNYLCSYCYLPRLANYNVLESAVIQGLNSKEYFGIAAGFTDGRYIELKLGDNKPCINKSDVLVKPGAAQTQIEKDRKKQPTAEEEPTDINNGENTENQGQDDNSTVVPGSAPTNPSLFQMVATVDNTRVNRDVQNIVQEIVEQLSSLDNVNINLNFEVRAHVDSGIPPETKRAISENCKTLGIDDFRFD